MKSLRVLLVGFLVFILVAPEAFSYRRGGAVRGGVGGAMVGGLIGGKSGAKRGAAIGAVAGGVSQARYNNAVRADYQAQQNYYSSQQYQSSTHSNFNENPPTVIAGTETATQSSAAPAQQEPPAPAAQQAAPAAAPAAEKEDATEPTPSVIKKNGKPVLGVTFPEKWAKSVGETNAWAVSLKGDAFAAIVLLNDAKDLDDGVEKLKARIEEYVDSAEFEETAQTEKGALIVIGKGKSKKSGVELVVAVGVFESGEDQVSGICYVLDKDVEELYKGTAKAIAETIRIEADFAE